jgi:hypothetical protein
VGKNLPTSFAERVRVSVAEVDGYDAVALEEAVGVTLRSPAAEGGGAR